MFSAGPDLEWHSTMSQVFGSSVASAEVDDDEEIFHEDSADLGRRGHEQA